MYYRNTMSTNNLELMMVRTMYSVKTPKTYNKSILSKYDNCDNKSRSDANTLNKQGADLLSAMTVTSTGHLLSLFMRQGQILHQSFECRTHHLRKTAFSDLYVADWMGQDTHETVS